MDQVCKIVCKNFISLKKKIILVIIAARAVSGTPLIPKKCVKFAQILNLHTLFEIYTLFTHRKIRPNFLLR